jgi:hypothetical protein
MIKIDKSKINFIKKKTQVDEKDKSKDDYENKLIEIQEN